jgi:hypothetical protein
MYNKTTCSYTWYCAVNVNILKCHKLYVYILVKIQKNWVCLFCSVGVYNWFTPCNTYSTAVGTVQCYQHSVCNNCILWLHFHTFWISESVHSGRDRLLGIVVSEGLTAAVFSVIVCGKAVHLFPLAEYRVFLLSDDMSLVTSPRLLVEGRFDYVNTIKVTTGSSNVQSTYEIITACLNTLTRWQQSLNGEMLIAEHCGPIMSAGPEDVGCFLCIKCVINVAAVSGRNVLLR